ncbi:PhzF family phenazine biosynthesis protein [Iodobacter fluviatilis]|uniref:Phenazine biosynthesis protein PhzC/PhzF n=1 Tax=Iodobacter fluviatilis TaxID=537 RepID=A0A7G3GAG3_9NEIS|nr:PhzF family phenazine biosynthesis protein [Iodobacter fluviatilis]QBC44347.1 phenazine biosynthesis protein PhzC/PhzF [Iodobacter fluviatilis]
MPTYSYCLVNVFAEDFFAGNQLAVFTNATGLDEATMQLLATQLNLSETTFVFPSQVASAKVKIFTPTNEMAFAGHPSLGTAVVIRDGRTEVSLELKAGIIPLRFNGDIATLTANPATHRAGPLASDLSQALGLPLSAFSEPAQFVDSGTEQLIVPLKTVDDVMACQPAAQFFRDVVLQGRNRDGTLVWAWQNGEIVARYFWTKHGQVMEDNGTGSACANLGAYLLKQGVQLPFAATMIQGHKVGRLAHLRLSITVDRQVEVGGRVVNIGRGEFDL